MGNRLPQRHNVFLLGVLVGAISIGMLWTIFFSSLSGEVKLAVFGLCTILGLGIQMYALRELKKPNFWRRYNLASFQQEIRNYRWFGIFVFGVASPYILVFFCLDGFKEFITSDCGKRLKLQRKGRY
jgi:hypothetical protein